MAARGKPQSLAKLLRAPVAYGGLLFFDSECTRQFPQPMLVREDKLAAFANCLATLPFVESPRFTTLTGSNILTYAPGIEVDIRFDRWNDGDFVSFIGYSSRIGLQDALPTIDSVVFEQLRANDAAIHPDEMTRPLLDAAARKNERGFLYSWIKVCLDSEGNVTSAQARETSSLDANEVFLAGIPRWKFKPFVLGGKPVPVCSVVLMTYPSSNRPEKEVMPLPEALEGDDVLRQPDVQTARISGQKLIEPDLGTKRGMQRLGLRRLVVLFNVCIDDTGRVVATKPIKSSGSASYDQVLMTTMSSWRYSPPTLRGQPTSACRKIQFVYTQ